GLLASGHSVSLLPGSEVSVSRSEIKSVRHGSSFVKTPPRTDWGAHIPWRYHSAPGTFPPACGQRDFQDVEHEALTDGLTSLAEFMYGGPLFKGLLSLGENRPEYHCTFILLLLADSDCRHFALEYSLTECL